MQRGRLGLCEETGGGEGTEARVRLSQMPGRVLGGLTRSCSHGWPLLLREEALPTALVPGSIGPPFCSQLHTQDPDPSDTELNPGKH